MRVQWSGFRVQDLRAKVELQVLNPEPRTLNPTKLDSFTATFGSQVP